MGAAKHFDEGRPRDERRSEKCITMLSIFGLSGDLRLRLLEHDPTPTFKSMTEFVKQYRAIQVDIDHAPACAVSSAPAPPTPPLQESINQLTADVAIVYLFVSLTRVIRWRKEAEYRYLQYVQIISPRKFQTYKPE